MSKLRTKIGVGILAALSISVLVDAANEPRALAVAAGGDTCATATPIASPALQRHGRHDAPRTTTRVFLSATCAGGGEISREGPDLIYSITVGAGNSLTFTLTPTTPSYDPVIYILGTCGTGASCTHHPRHRKQGAGRDPGADHARPRYALPLHRFRVSCGRRGGRRRLQPFGDRHPRHGVVVGNKFFTLDPVPPDRHAECARALPVARPSSPHRPGRSRSPDLCGVPVGAKAVSINATVIPTTPGYLTAYPGGPDAARFADQLQGEPDPGEQRHRARLRATER